MKDTYVFHLVHFTHLDNSASKVSQAFGRCLQRLITGAKNSHYFEKMRRRFQNTYSIATALSLLEMWLGQAGVHGAFYLSQMCSCASVTVEF